MIVTTNHHRKSNTQDKTLHLYDRPPPTPIYAVPAPFRAILPRRVSLLPPPHARPNPTTVFLPARQHHDRHIHERDQGSNNTVNNLAGARVIRELQAQTAVDDAEGDEGAAEPDVRGGPEGAARGADEAIVVYYAKEGLEEEERDHDDADDGVGRVEL